MTLYESCADAQLALRKAAAEPRLCGKNITRQHERECENVNALWRDYEEVYKYARRENKTRQRPLGA